jgi:hypothetical protein
MTRSSTLASDNLWEFLSLAYTKYPWMLVALPLQRDSCSKWAYNIVRWGLIKLRVYIVQIDDGLSIYRTKAYIYRSAAHRPVGLCSSSSRDIVVYYVRTFDPILNKRHIDRPSKHHREKPPGRANGSDLFAG